MTLGRVGRDRRATLDPSGGPDLRLPEQRLLDVAARYGWLSVGEPQSAGQPASAAGVRIVAPTEPSEAGAPVWVRRLGERDAAATPPAETPAETPAELEVG